MARVAPTVNGVDAMTHPNLLDAPAFGAFTVSKSDTVSQGTTRAIYVGGTGDLAVTMAFGEVITFKSVPAGTILPLVTTLIMATNTTATNMVGMV